MRNSLPVTYTVRRSAAWPQAKRLKSNQIARVAYDGAFFLSTFLWSITECRGRGI